MGSVVRASTLQEVCWINALIKCFKQYFINTFINTLNVLRVNRMLLWCANKYIIHVFLHMGSCSISA